MQRALASSMDVPPIPPFEGTLTPIASFQLILLHIYSLWFMSMVCHMASCFNTKDNLVQGSWHARILFILGHFSSQYSRRLPKPMAVRQLIHIPSKRSKTIDALIDRGPKFSIKMQTHLQLHEFHALFSQIKPCVFWNIKTCGPSLTYFRGIVHVHEGLLWE